jgi:hypothetical protein
MTEDHPTVAILHFEFDVIDVATPSALYPDPVWQSRGRRHGWGDSLDVCEVTVDDSGWVSFGTVFVVGTDNADSVEHVRWNSLPPGYISRIEWIEKPVHVQTNRSQSARFLPASMVARRAHAEDAARRLHEAILEEAPTDG